MALTGWSTSNHLKRTAVVGAEPFFVCAWLYTPLGGGSFRAVFGSGTAGSLDNSRWSDLDDSNFSVVQARNATTSVGTSSSPTAHPASSWFATAWAWTSSTSRSAFLASTRNDDGTSCAPSAGSATYIGIRTA